ncbi:hypothetical protein ABZU86_19770 [Streptomyces sp. NPDC005271]|uniref:hypothetical protein n=1 Tax=unclassified Streptomyces TaxID=2593676 RepID=UPI0033AEDA99
MSGSVARNDAVSGDALGNLFLTAILLILMRRLRTRHGVTVRGGGGPGPRNGR